MGVDDHLLKQLGKTPLPSLGTNTLFQSPPVAAPHATARASNPKSDVSFRELRSEIKRLTSAINELLQVFSKAHEDIKTEPSTDIAHQLGKLVEQNEEIARALLLLLEIHREHLPQIAKNTRLSSELKLRRPSAKLFSDSVRK